MSTSKNSKRVYQTDWLASKPVFYNQEIGKISYNINDVIDYDEIEFHPEGLNNYLDFGYSVFGQTPLTNVKFLRHSSEIFKENGKLIIIEHPDPVEKWFSEHQSFTDENELLDLIKYKIQKWEDENDGLIVIPSSGGFDSRLLNYFIKDKSRIRAYTYGTSPDQKNSYEVVYAKKYCDILGIQWKQIPLGYYHQYINTWLDLYGLSVHAHGMYHLEFYNKILKHQEASMFLSGIIGDGWSGGIENILINDISEFNRIGYTHGMNADASKSKLDGFSNLKKCFYQNNNINDPRLQIVHTLRLKMILLSYLRVLPEHLRFSFYSPFLDIDIALGMLNLPPDRRKNRRWQIDFFKKSGIYVEDMKLKASKKNALNFQATQRIPLKPLNVSLLSEIIEPDYVQWINNKIEINFIDSFANHFTTTKYLKGGLKLLGLDNSWLKAYSAYLTLLPLEQLLAIKAQRS